MDKKYYWVLYRDVYRDYNLDSESVTDKHPFQERKELNDYIANAQFNATQEVILLNWREITEEDYNLFKKMENE